MSAGEKSEAPGSMARPLAGDIHGRSDTPSVSPSFNTASTHQESAKEGQGISSGDATGSGALEPASRERFEKIKLQCEICGRAFERDLTLE